MKNKKTAMRLRELLDEFDLKAQDLADKAKINKASISQYINGTHKPSNLSATKIASALYNINPVWVMGFDVPKYIDNLKSDKHLEELDNIDASQCCDLFLKLDHDDRQDIIDLMRSKLKRDKYQNKKDSSATA